MSVFYVKSCMGHYVETSHLFCNELCITQSLFFPEECHNVASNNTVIKDENSETCVEIPLYNETEGVHELFSLHFREDCVNNSRVAVAMHLNTTTTGITCGHKIGILTYDSTRCDGLTACKVSPKIFVYVSFKEDSIVSLSTREIFIKSMCNSCCILCQVQNPDSAIASGCLFSCLCDEDSGCNISFHYGKNIVEVQELRVCEANVLAQPQ